MRSTRLLQRSCAAIRRNGVLEGANGRTRDARRATCRKAVSVARVPPPSQPCHIHHILVIILRLKRASRFNLLLFSYLLLNLSLNTCSGISAIKTEIGLTCAIAAVFFRNFRARSTDILKKKGQKQHKKRNSYEIGTGHDDESGSCVASLHVGCARFDYNYEDDDQFRIARSRGRRGRARPVGRSSGRLEANAKRTVY